MTRTSGQTFKLFVWVALAGATLALGACGRKAGLDLPPSAAAAPTGTGANAGTGTNEAAAAPANDTNGKTGANAAQGNLFNTANPSDRTMYAPKLPPKRILIDPILD